MIPVAFGYERATSVDDALAKLAAGDGGKLIAGGHSLVPLMKLRLSEPGRLVDISRIPGLSGIKQVGGRIEIGATTVYSDIAGSTLLRDKCPMIAEAAAEVGDPQVRNRGTIGGSIAHADPAADFPAVMVALDADIQIKGTGGARAVKAAAFFRGFYEVDLAPGELIVGVQFDAVRSASYAKLHQRASHYAVVGVAAALEVQGGVIQSARIGLTGATTHAVRLTAVEKALAGQKADGVAAACAAAADEIADLNADLHASADYRKAMVPVFTRRAVEEHWPGLEVLRARGLLLHAGEEAILHHLCRAGNQALAEPGDGPAGLRRTFQVNDGVGAIGAKRNYRVAFDEPRAALPLDGETVRRRVDLLADHHRAFVAAGNGGHADGDRGLVAIGAVRLEPLTSGDARRDLRRVHQQGPDAWWRRREGVGAGDVHGG